jgi:hypothetical protein
MIKQAKKNSKTEYPILLASDSFNTIKRKESGVIIKTEMVKTPNEGVWYLVWLI